MANNVDNTADSALAKYSQVVAMSSPRDTSLAFIRSWLYGSNNGEGKAFINKGGNIVETLTWSEKTHKDDFVSIANSAERDIWTLKIVTVLVATWQYILGRRRVDTHSWPTLILND